MKIVYKCINWTEHNANPEIAIIQFVNEQTEEIVKGVVDSSH